MTSMPAPTDGVPEVSLTDSTRAYLDRAFPPDGVARMTREDLIRLIADVSKDARVSMAVKEAVASQRIFADIEGVAAAMTPFRVTTKEQLESLCAEYAKVISPKTHLVVALCVVDVEQARPITVE